MRPETTGLAAVELSRSVGNELRAQILAVWFLLELNAGDVKGAEVAAAVGATSEWAAPPGLINAQTVSNRSKEQCRTPSPLLLKPAWLRPIEHNRRRP